MLTREEIRDPLIAPNRVNHPFEHHQLMTVPRYNLPRLHRLRHERGVLERALPADGYLEVLREAAASGRAVPAAAAAGR